MEVLCLAIGNRGNRLLEGYGATLLLCRLQSLSQQGFIVLHTGFREFLRGYTLEVALIVLKGAKKDTETAKIVRNRRKGGFGGERPSYEFETVMNGDLLRVLAVACQRERRLTLSGGSS